MRIGKDLTVFYQLIASSFIFYMCGAHNVSSRVSYPERSHAAPLIFFWLMFFVCSHDGLYCADLFCLIGRWRTVCVFLISDISNSCMRALRSLARVRASWVSLSTIATTVHGDAAIRSFPFSLRDDVFDLSADCLSIIDRPTVRNAQSWEEHF